MLFHSHPETGGPRLPSGYLGFSNELYCHPRHVTVLHHLLPAGERQAEGKQKQVQTPTVVETVGTKKIVVKIVYVIFGFEDGTVHF